MKSPLWLLAGAIAGSLVTANTLWHFATPSPPRPHPDFPSETDSRAITSPNSTLNQVFDDVLAQNPPLSDPAVFDEALADSSTSESIIELALGTAPPATTGQSDIPEEPPVAQPSGFATDTPSPTTSTDEKTAESGDPPSSNTPRQLNPPSELQLHKPAAPIDPKVTHREAAIRELIARELPRSSPEERDIWFETLQGLDPEDAEAILRIRVRFGTKDHSDLTPAPFSLNPENSRSSSSLPALPPQSEPDLTNSHPSITTLSAALDIIDHNLANALTPGFKRRHITFSENAPLDSTTAKTETPSPSSAVNFQATLDLTPGPLEDTSDPHQVVIIGSGFLAARDGEQIHCFRSGRLQVNEAGFLCLNLNHKLLPLHPPVELGGDAHTFSIDEFGRISFPPTLEPSTKPAPQLSLTVLPHPEHLRPAGNGQFSLTHEAGTPETASPGTPTTGHIRTRTIELSNVDLDTEARLHRKIQTMVRLLTRAPREALPAQTAESPPPAGSDTPR